MAMVYYGYDMIWYMDSCMKHVGSTWMVLLCDRRIKDHGCNGYMILIANHVCVCRDVAG